MSRSALRPQDHPSEPTRKKEPWQPSGLHKTDMIEPLYMETATAVFRMQVGVKVPSCGTPIIPSGFKGLSESLIPLSARLLCSLLLTLREPHCPGPLLGRQQTVARGVPWLSHIIRGASLSPLSLTSFVHETAVAIFVTVRHGVVQLPHQVPRRAILPRG